MEGKGLVLIIEDEEDILELEEFHLQKAGFETLGFLSTKKVRQALEEESVDLLVVDRNLPGAEGSEFVAELRKDGYRQPVIFVTAKDQEEQVLEGFRRGGDDYLRKPFGMKEFVARVEALLRRNGSRCEGPIRWRGVQVDPVRRQAWKGGEPLQLSRLEFDLLFYFLQSGGRTISREELLERVWPEGEQRGSKSVNVAINRLKKKVDTSGESPIIEAVRGIGYRLC